MKVKRKKIWIVTAIVISLIGLSWWENESIGITEVVVEDNKVPKGFDGYRILQVSDLHNKEFGENNCRLFKKVEEAKADCIVITGDLVDGNRTKLDVAIQFAKKCVEIVPTYFVSGNHEKWSGIYDELKEELEQSGVHVLSNTSIDLKRGEDTIRCIGVEDPAFNKSEYSENSEEEQMIAVLEGLTSKTEKFQILLSHRPEQLSIYAEQKVDLVFSGHAHGGQFRLPFIGGVIAPDQGLFPKLTNGVHKEKETTMVISRGLGNSIIPIRVFNRPELICVTLKNKNEKVE